MARKSVCFWQAFSAEKVCRRLKKNLPSVSKEYIVALTPVQNKTGKDQKVLVRRNRKNPVKKSLLLQLSLVTKAPMCLKIIMYV
jgi:hypothetical protein